jgi:hypothetical protein
VPKFVAPEEYLARAIKRHEGKYSYDVLTLCSANAAVPIACPVHGVFHQRLANHLNGVGCPKCAGRGVDWVERFRSVHGDTYDYQKVFVQNYKQPVVIICPTHGAFKQTPDNHYRGKQGCPKCKGVRIRAAKQLPVEAFIRRAHEVHKGKYQYQTAQFTNVLTGVVSILCPLHGEFKQSPVNHLAGKVGCTKCNNMKSKGEDVIFRLVSSWATAQQRDRKLLAPKELDIYLPEHKLAIEYCGMFWHSHGSAEDERKDRRKHYDKYAACKELGIRLLTVYEEEWLNRKYAIRRLLRNAVGKSKGRLMARKCELRKVSTAQAKVFYDRYHPQGGAGNGEHYALFWKGKMVACMRFTYGANDRGAGAAKRSWTLGRYATRVTVAGAASRLFKAFVQEHNPPEVKSFSDNRYFDGGMYKQLGFVLAEEVAPDYGVWSQKLGLRPKSHYQRRLLPDRLREHGVSDQFDPETDPRTEAEMTYLMGCRRMYDCGKKKWLWLASPQ